MSSVGEVGSDPTPIPVDAFPTDPTQFAPTKHFEKRAADDDRIITKKLAAEAIAGGEIGSAGEGSWKYSHRREGLDIIVICAIGNELEPVIVTGFAEVWDATEAIIDGGFDRRRVKTEKLRNNLVGVRGFTDELRTMSYSPAHTVNGHDIITRSGDEFVECVECGTRFYSKSELGVVRCDR